MDGQRRRYSSMLAARARRRRIQRRLSIVIPVAALFFYLAVRTRPTPSTPSATPLVVDLGVLAKADAFVGSLWSNVGRLSYELSAADKGCLPPLISRDVGWCSVDGQLQDGTVYGHLNC